MFPRGGEHWGLRYCGIGPFFMRYFGIFSFELRYYGIFWTCGMRVFSIIGGIKNYRLSPATFSELSVLSDCFGNKLKQGIRHLLSRELPFET